MKLKSFMMYSLVLMTLIMIVSMMVNGQGFSYEPTPLFSSYLWRKGLDIFFVILWISLFAIVGYFRRTSNRKSKRGSFLFIGILMIWLFVLAGEVAINFHKYTTHDTKQAHITVMEARTLTKDNYVTVKDKNGVTYQLYDKKAITDFQVGEEILVEFIDGRNKLLIKAGDIYL